MYQRQSRLYERGTTSVPLVEVEKPSEKEVVAPARRGEPEPAILTPPIVEPAAPPVAIGGGGRSGQGGSDGGMGGGAEEDDEPPIDRTIGRRLGGN